MQAYIKEINRLATTQIKIGIPESAGTYPSGASVVNVGVKHELGLGVVRKPFMRVLATGTLSDSIHKEAGLVLAGESTTDKLVADVIDEGVSQVQGYLANNVYNTGRLHGSITGWRVTNG